MELRTRVDTLIDAELEKNITLLGPTEETLKFLFELVEQQYSRGDFRAGESLRPALDIYTSKIIKGLKPESTFSCLGTFDWSSIFSFSSAYYDLRDLIYLSYDNPESVEWSEANSTITITLRDTSFTEQIVYEHHLFALSSAVLPREKPLSRDELYGLLSTTDRWDHANPDMEKILAHVTSETNIKIEHFFSYVPESSEASLGDYSYCEFYKVYHNLLLFSMYERYHASANQLSCVITLAETEISEHISKVTEVPLGNCVTILKDISSSSRGTFNYLPSQQKYLLLPFSFSLKDGISSMLKQYASRDSDRFSGQFAIIIGDALVEEISKLFSQFRNFKTEKEILLQNYDPSLPDIDVLALSYEPSLGFHAFVCEVKNNLPATWAKEYLKTKGKKGAITKALEQAQKLKNFLKTSQGIDLLQGLIQKKFSHLDFQKLFPTGYCITIDFLIVTSQSMGVFFPDRATAILNNTMLKHIVSRSDGDTKFILWHLWNMQRYITATYEEGHGSLHLEAVTIKFSTPRIKSYINIEQNSYLSDGQLESLEEESLRTGYRFIDTLDISDVPDHQKFLITVR
ncbi:hypothetical protein K8U54_19915 [Pseudomonas fulva]|uniref:hypothetical protein n=1 Tax=Pseudomonas fulva TaxID=47880 RepID=UPI00201DAA18|nr:hypothetical protein [Pseudomonas fulva]UQY33952.1 hypothetical protein K8U54_19915 [Pseudomonas fulva]